MDSPTLMVLATLSTAASFPRKGCAPFFLVAGSFLATAAFLSAVGTLVLWARSCACSTRSAAMRRSKLCASAVVTIWLRVGSGNRPCHFVSAIEAAGSDAAFGELPGAEIGRAH